MASSTTKSDTTRRLRALWALNVCGGLDEAALVRLLDDRDEAIRGWAVRLLVDRDVPSAAAMKQLVAMARADGSPRVRLSLASALQRIPIKDRWPLAEPLAEAAIDPQDPMLPLMTWYGIEPLAGSDPVRAAALGVALQYPAHSQLPGPSRRDRRRGRRARGALAGTRALRGSRPPRSCSRESSMRSAVASKFPGLKAGRAHSPNW